LQAEQNNKLIHRHHGCILLKKRKKRKKKTEAKAVKETPKDSDDKPTENTATIEPTKEEDISVLQSEINDIRKAVVSMSVGQPNTATRIVQEWLEDETLPAAPEPEKKEETSDDEKKK